MNRNIWTPAYLGLGSNLADPAAQLRQALAELRQLPRSRLVLVSQFVQSAPLGPVDQPDYLNAAVALLTRLAAAELLDECQRLEKGHKRRRDGIRWGPRTLDLDLLVFGDQIIGTDDLTVPHPGIAERAFVLAPLLEIAPALRVPGLGTVARLAEHVDLDSIAPFKTAEHVA